MKLHFLLILASILSCLSALSLQQDHRLSHGLAQIKSRIHRSGGGSGGGGHSAGHGDN